MGKGYFGLHGEAQRSWGVSLWKTLPIVIEFEISIAFDVLLMWFWNLRFTPTLSEYDLAIVANFNTQCVCCSLRINLDLTVAFFLNFTFRFKEILEDPFTDLKHFIEKALSRVPEESNDDVSVWCFRIF